MNRYLMILFVVLVSALSISIKSCSAIKQDRNRLSDNQQALFDDVHYYETQNGLSVASVERLTLKASELEGSNSELMGVCDDLRIKVKRLQSASTTATEVKYEFKTILRDSIVVRDSVILDTIRCIIYEDMWLSFEGCTSNNIDFNVAIESRDTITQVVHRVPKKFWFIKYGTKAIRQEITTKNPYSKIIYTEYIELE